MKIVIYVLLTVLLFSKASAQSTSPQTRAKIKTVYIFNFTKYFEWNEINRSSEFRIGVLGADSLIKKELEILAAKKTVNNLPIKIVSFSSAAEVVYTEMLYVDFKKNPDYKINKKYKNTLVVTENNPDLNNTMIAFIMDGEKQKIAINEVNIKNSGILMSPIIKSLAAQVITGTDKKADEVKMQEWKSVFDKFTDALKNNSSEITLSKKEAQEVVNTINNKENEIKTQQKNLAEQKAKIDEQLQSITTQEQKLKLQEEKLDLTIQQNKAQEADLEIAKQEVKIQQEKINDQKSVLLGQQKDIDVQNKKLITQLGQINSQKTILYLAGFLVLIIAGALFIAYKGNKNKQRANALLSKQKMEIEHQRELVEEKQKEILDSINYARRIQYSLLASNKLLDENLSSPGGGAAGGGGYFLFFKPKDVVSGDFYWGTSTGSATNKKFILVTADSTGHGVPGSIMSMLNISCLNEAINADKLIQPADILNATRKKVIEHLSNDGSDEGGKDGMDCSLVCLDFKNKKLTYAAANNPVWIVRSNSPFEGGVRRTEDVEFISLAPDRMPVGKHDRDTTPFTQHEFELEKGDMVYTLTDGFPDQFGGPKGKKFKYKQLEELLLSIAYESMETQKQKLEKVFENWKGDLEQVDDVCIIGIRI